METVSSFDSFLVEERCLRITLFVDDPAELDVGAKEVRISSGGKRLVFPLSEEVLPTAPLNAAKYFRSSRRLELVLRRPFASSTWQMFDLAEKKMARLQDEARRLFGSSVDQGFQIDGDPAESEKFTYDLHVDEEKGVIINLQSPSAGESDMPMFVLGDTKENDKILLPWSKIIEPCSSSDEDVDYYNQEDKAAQCAAVDARLARQSFRSRLRVGLPRAKRANGQKVKGLSVFTTCPRKAGEAIVCYRGCVLPRTSVSSMPKAKRARAQRYFFRLDSQWVMDGGTGGTKPRAAHIGALINSPVGCIADDGSELQPNIVPHIDPLKGLGQRAIQLVAARDIDTDEELLYDYGDQHKMDVVSPESSCDEF